MEESSTKMGEQPPAPAARRAGGFATMTMEKKREIASLGGTAAHEQGTAHRFTSKTGRKAGQKGGEAVSRDREHMVAIGRAGGKQRWANQRQAEGRDG